MDNQRIMLWGLFAALAFLTLQQWQLDSPADTVDVVTATGGVTQPVLPANIPAMPAGSAGKLDKAAAPVLPPAPGGVLAPVQTAAYQPATILVTTDVLEIEIGLQGGTLLNAQLRKYPLSKDNPDALVQLLRADIAERYVIESGLIDPDKSGATHEALFNAPRDRYVLTDGQDELVVPLTWHSADGVTVTKIYTLRRGRYNIDLQYSIANDSNEDWLGLSYLQISRVHTPPERSMFNVDSYSYNGPVVFDAEKYEKIDPEDLAEEPLEQTLAGGWIASLEHHFVAAAIPDADSNYRYDASYGGGTVVMRASGADWTVVKPGEHGEFAAQIFVGPKLQNQLTETAEGLPLTADYGILAILARPLFWLLEKVHSFIGNWGWSIILVTFMIKATFYKLTEASGRSMAKMRKLQPRLKALQERYKDDRQKLSQQMMELYKREKVNPAAGCLPMLIQIPFFIAFYWVLLESVEMRQAPFALWITDLSSRDPFFVLPLLMGIAMFVQQKLNPAPPDPIQAKVMQILPVMFTGFFAFFPSGLVLYWLTNSVLSVLQQWNINRKMAVD
jgi:YidC/Oxa1 family membrane protein insertase